MTPANSKPDRVTTTRTQPREDLRTRLLPPYNVVLLNDDHHSAPFVIAVLCKVLGCPPERAYELMLTAHTAGRSVIWTGPKEVAELKAEQVQTFHETREEDGAHLGPLGCVIEPAP